MFDVGELGDGVWRGARGASAAFWLNGEITLDSSVTVHADLVLRDGGGQVLTLFGRTDGDVRLAQWSDLPETFVDLVLALDAASDAVKVWFYGQYHGV